MYPLGIGILIFTVPLVGWIVVLLDTKEISNTLNLTFPNFSLIASKTFPLVIDCTLSVVPSGTTPTVALNFILVTVSWVV